MKATTITKAITIKTIRATTTTTTTTTIWLLSTSAVVLCEVVVDETGVVVVVDDVVVMTVVVVRVFVDDGTEVESKVGTEIQPGSVPFHSADALH